jgi:glucose-1-phosphate adenylyltransferase
MPHDPKRAYASMGNYLFNARVLGELLEEANRHEGVDFGRHVLPRLPGRRRIYAYDFSANRVPGVRPYEEPAYWRDVGTHRALAAAQQDIEGPLPRFNLDNRRWPIGAVMARHANAITRRPFGENAARSAYDRSQKTAGSFLGATPQSIL